MKKLQIFDIKEYEYYLKDSNNNIYNLNLEFYNMNKPKINSYIYISEKLIRNTIERMYSFGPLNNEIGYKVKEEDIIKIIDNDKELYLQRYYG